MLNKAVTFDDAGYVGYDPQDNPDKSFVQNFIDPSVISAAWERENTVASTVTNPRLDYDVHKLTDIDPMFDPFKDIKGYEQYAPLFEHVYNATAAQALKEQIDKRRKEDATLAQSGWAGSVWQFAAGAIDLPSLLPGGAVVRSGKLGYSALRSAASVGLAAGLSSAAQEAVLQSNQPTRTAEESLLAVGGSTILGGILGAGLSKLFTHGEWSRVSKSLEEDLSGEVANPNAVVDQMVKRAQAAGAQSVEDLAPQLADMGIGGPKIAQIVANASAAARVNPGIRTLLSPSAKVRETYLKMVDNPVMTTMNMEGKNLGPDVENLVKIYNRGAYGQWKRLADQEYLKYRKMLGQNAVTARLPAPGGMMTKSDFMEAVAKAARHNDIDVNGNEFVTRTAQAAREKVFDPLFQMAKEAKLLPEDVKTTTAASYVTRLWNREKLIGEEPRFRQIAREYFAGELDKIESMQKAGKDAPATPDFVSEADKQDYIDQVVTEVFNNLTGKGKGDVPEWIVPLKKGPLKERTFNIPDAKVEDFLHNDAEMILRRYSRSMAADIELTKRFGRADLKDQFDAITKDYEQLRKAAKTPAERTKLDKAEEKDVKHLTAFRDMLRGTYQAADRSSGWSAITNAALTWNYMRLLGGVTLSSLTDAARFPAVHGLSATMKEGFPSLVKNTKAIKIAKQDAKDLGTVAEQVMQARFASLADLRDPYRYGNRYERFLDNAANIFTKATGIGWWTDTMNMIASVMSENRILKNAMNWNGMDKYEKAYMGFVGINEEMAARIAEQFKKYGTKEEGIHGANVREWDDVEAYRALGAALNKDVDRTIIKPGMGDKPLWMKTNTGRLIMQFKTFGLASHQRMLILGLQERPRRMMEGMIFGTALGMLTGYLKMVERGDYEKANNLLENPGKWIGDGLDRWGGLYLPFEITNTADKVSAALGGANVSIPSVLSRIAGDKDHSGAVTRYQSRDPLGAVLGPTAGLFSDLATIYAAVTKGERTKAATNAALREIPGSALPGVRTILNSAVKPALQ